MLGLFCTGGFYFKKRRRGKMHNLDYNNAVRYRQFPATSGYRAEALPAAVDFTEALAQAYDVPMKFVQPPFLRRRWNFFTALYLLLVLGAALLLLAPAARPPTATGEPQRVDTLASGSLATLDSPPFRYSEGWRVSAAGADPHEPRDPWGEPSGVLEFEYAGRDLALQIASGEYWGYLYVTVDGAPASELPTITGNVDARGQLAGYQTFYPTAPLDPTTPQVLRWLAVHRASSDGPHAVRVELWRAWGQTPLRAVAIDATTSTPAPLAQTGRWLAVALLGLLLLNAGVALIGRVDEANSPLLRPLRQRLDAIRPPPAMLVAVAGAGVASVGLGVALNAAWLCWLGLAMLGLAAIRRPALWVAALVFALPFYFAVSLPLLSGPHLSLLDVGLLGGLGVLIAHALANGQRRPRPQSLPLAPQALVLAALVIWLLATTARLNGTPTGPLADVALREWRTVFLSAGLFALILAVVFYESSALSRDRRLVVVAWLGGATVVSLIALWQFATGNGVIEAEGVRRVRALYGSPNNLALYLERSTMVAVALMLFTDSAGNSVLQKLGLGSRRLPFNVGWALLALPQLLALRLTYSRGAIFLGVPAALVTLALGGGWLLRASREGEAKRRLRRALWGVAIVAGVGVLAVLPSFSAERFRGLADLSRGTGFVRLQLWRSSWPMALDHPWFGVGLDGFLYAYRSGYLLPAAWQDPNLNHPHNILLDGWTRLGLPGLLLLVAWFALGVRTLLRAVQRASATAQAAVDPATSFQAALPLGLLAAATAGLAHGLIDASYALPDLMLLWVLLFTLPTAPLPPARHQPSRA